MSARVRTFGFLLLLLLIAACGKSQAPVLAGARSYKDFQTEVYPVLLRDCGFPACHGASERFFRVYGPGRTRLPLMSTGQPLEALGMPSGDELGITWHLAESMIDERDLGRSLLLRKPLAVEAGGAGHMGQDNFGRDVYRTTQDAGFLVLARWVYGPRMPPMTAAQQPTMMMTAPPAP
jgi:hypothetical protein